MSNNQQQQKTPVAGGQSQQQQQPETKIDQQAGSVLDALSFTNSILAILIIYVLYKLFYPKKRNEEEERFILPDPLPKHDMTLDELRKYDGNGPDKRVCIAILGCVYDCTKGYHFYGPGGTYSTFAGRDASRALAKFDVFAVKDEWDDITDLEEHELSAVMEWNEQFKERYDYIGRLVRSKEEILEKPDFEESLSSSSPSHDDEGKGKAQQQQQQQKTDEKKQTSKDNNNDKTSKSSTDDEIEVINSDDNGLISSKKVSFINLPESGNDHHHHHHHQQQESDSKDNNNGDEKKSDSSDDIEVLDHQ